ncbi:unnamed protein product [Lymnaea stagnalis]|uniref:OPA3-like protein n=1 Tax=Lymnaea stagnalis TaxID=6523 RepID=A0AAV2H317_LYMST
MAPFPLIKLAYLAVKQISKPIANSIKRRAKSHPFFRTYICMPPAQFYHWCEVNFRLRLMGLGQAKNVEKLPDKEAIELGGEMLGEFIVFSLACLVVISEYLRGSRKEAAKEEKSKQELGQIQCKISEIAAVTEVQQSQIFDLQKQIDILMEEKIKQQLKNTSGQYVKKLLG